MSSSDQNIHKAAEAKDTSLENSQPEAAIIENESRPAPALKNTMPDRDQAEEENDMPRLEIEDKSLEKEESPTVHEHNGLQDNKTEEQAQTITSLWTPVWDSNAQAYYWWNTETNETTWVNPEAEAATAVPAEQTGEKEPLSEETKDISQEAQQPNPLDFLLDRIDNVVKKKLDGQEDVDPSAIEDINTSTTTLSSAYDYSQYYYSTDDTSYYNASSSSSDPYTVQAHFDPRTGRFKSQMDVHLHNPENLSIENRATRQMQHYFDVDQYTEQINAQRQMVAEGRITKQKQLTRKDIEHFKKMKKEKKTRKAREWLLQ